MTDSLLLLGPGRDSKTQPLPSQNLHSSRGLNEKMTNLRSVTKGEIQVL